MIHCRAHTNRRVCRAHVMSVYEAKHPRSIDLIRKFVEPVIAQLIVHIEHDRDAAGDADGETDDVDQRICFLPEEISQGDFEIVGNHEEILE